VIFDPSGAAVAGAKITITNQKTTTSREPESDAEGKFEFANLPPVGYDLTLTKNGFKKLGLKSVTLAAKETVSLELILELATQAVTMGIIADESPLSTPPGTMIPNGVTIRKLPIPQ
jgi:hypothetical protein